MTQAYQEIYNAQDYSKLQSQFEAFLCSQNPELFKAYIYAKSNTDNVSKKEESALLIEIAPFLEEFIADLLGIQKEVQALQTQENRFAPLVHLKRQFIQRRALKSFTVDDFIDFDPAPIQHEMNGNAFDFAFAEKVLSLLSDEKVSEEALTPYARYAAWASLTPDGLKKHCGSILFTHPQKIDFENLLSSFEENDAENHRDGFSLTDHGLSSIKAADQAHYCIVCHKQGKDSCSTGVKSKDPHETCAKNPLCTPLKGCPLDQKISEMNSLKADGFNIASLAVAMIDNPLLALTGHRICNDCMKSCIYQKQDPVNIPGVESHILKAVLNLPYGFEIYHLLSRWNPLNLKRTFTKPSSGYKILIVGAGPAGLNLAYHLLQEGHTVVIIEGAKVEPSIPQTALIKDHKIILEDLDTRKPKGVGGVAEYGITVRWDKNNLTLVRTLLERHANFMILGSVRFGGTLTTAQAFDELGFDHISLCCGAGRPNLMTLPGVDAKGIRYASDFLMNLQHGGAFLMDSIASMDLMLPAVVIGGGLTSIDTACEVLAYYPRYCQKIAQHFASLKETTQNKIMENLTSIEKERLQKILTHHKRFQEIRETSKIKDTAPNFLPLLKELGGVTLLYRKDFKQAPSYKLNHEEVLAALHEGIEIIDHAIPTSFTMDTESFVTGVEITQNSEKRTIPASSVFIATGTSPNTNITEDEAFYEKDHFSKENFVAYTHRDGKTVTFFGDMHPSYNGNVVKAMASAKDGYPKINMLLKEYSPAKSVEFLAFIKKQLASTVTGVKHLSQNIYELEIYAPFAAKNFKPGQFYKLQNYTSASLKTFEPIAATGARVDKEKGVISTVLLNIGASTNLASKLSPGQAIAFMGPTGQASEIPSNKNVLLIGGGVGNAVLFSVAEACVQQGCKVLWIAGFKKKEDLFYPEYMQMHAASVIYACDTERLPTHRDKDLSLKGNILDALEMFRAANKSLAFAFDGIEHVLVVGSNRMMEAVHDYFSNSPCPGKKIASINAPMQCMLKGVCATCLQKQEDGRYLYTCAEQDQRLKNVSFQTLSLRLQQNAISEKIYGELLKDGGRNRD